MFTHRTHSKKKEKYLPYQILWRQSNSKWHNNLKYLNIQDQEENKITSLMIGLNLCQNISAQSVLAPLGEPLL